FLREPAPPPRARHLRLACPLHPSAPSPPLAACLGRHDSRARRRRSRLRALGSPVPFDGPRRGHGLPPHQLREASTGTGTSRARSGFLASARPPDTHARALVRQRAEAAVGRERTADRLAEGNEQRVEAAPVPAGKLCPERVLRVDRPARSHVPPAVC